MTLVAEKPEKVQLAPTIESLLAQLRRGIRAYIWAEGLALAVVALGVSFWLSLGFDWIFEPPAVLRIVVLVIVGITMSWVLFRYILRRAFVPLADRSMAMLLERRFNRFQDSLLTTVELAETPGRAAQFNEEMLLHTQDEALAGSSQLPVWDTLNMRPLVRRGVLAIILLTSVIGFGIAANEAFGIWARRSVLLSNELWPRKTHLFVRGFDDNQRKKIARGADFDLVVQADAATGRDVPEVVEIRYLQGEAKGRENMRRLGDAAAGRDEFQDYTYTFKSVLAPLEFYVRGGDDRVGPRYLDVVDSPTVGQMILHCEYPSYMNRPARDIAVAGAMQLPRGTRVTIEAESNKDLVQVQVDDLIDDQTPQTHKIDLSSENGSGSREFQYVIESLDADKTLRFTLLDSDGIRSRDPVRLTLSAVPDEEPQLGVQLKGIGIAITPNARLPVAGEISDDYGVARAWFQYHVDDQPPQEKAFATETHGQDRLPVDQALEVESLGLAPKQKFHLAVQAADTYALGDKPNVGTSQQYVLDVVTPEHLRSILEARELLLRRRFETIIEDMTETRDALARIDFGQAKPSEEKPAKSEPKKSEADEPSKESATPADPAARGVQTERVMQNSRRTADETLGVAAAFDTIREELINNRVDTEELKIRLKDGIADPMRRIVGEMFPEFERRLQALQQHLADPQAAAESQIAAREQADAILVQMTLVLDKMLELETFNEVLDLLRGIISSQEKVQGETKEKQKEKLKNLLEEE